MPNGTPQLSKLFHLTHEQIYDLYNTDSSVGKEFIPGTQTPTSEMKCLHCQSWLLRCCALTSLLPSLWHAICSALLPPSSGTGPL